MSDFPKTLQLQSNDPFNGYVPACAHNLINFAERQAERQSAICKNQRVAELSQGWNKRHPVEDVILTIEHNKAAFTRG